VSKLPEKIGRYEVQRLLGQGAMGSVYLARDPSLDRLVAVKTVRELDLAADQKKRFLERFRNEAKAAARLADPTIVQVYDVGEDPGIGGPFLVFEFVLGSTLKQVLRDRGAFPADEAVDVARQIGRALDLAHQASIIHRDVKPDNILLAEDGRAKLADFGVARLPDAALTKEGQFLGTPCYAAPETLSLGKYGPRTDIFSFAAVVYEMTSGVRAFPGDDAISVAHAVIHDHPAAPSDVAKVSVPKGVDAVIMRGLDKKPENRFATAMELAEALEAAFIDAGVLAPAEGGPPSRSMPRPGGATGAWFAGLLVIVLALGGLAMMAFGNGAAVLAGDGDAGIADGGWAAVDASDRPAARDAGGADAVDAPIDAAVEIDAAVVEPELSRQEREDRAKDELDLARSAVERGAIDEARSHLERARALDPESSDLEEIDALVRGAH
jgi:hypothetical protein